MRNIKDPKGDTNTLQKKSARLLQLFKEGVKEQFLEHRLIHYIQFFSFKLSFTSSYGRSSLNGRSRIQRIALLIACVASVSVRSMSKERGTRVKDRAKNGASKRRERQVVALVSFLARSKPKIPLLGLLCCETKRKRLRRRLLYLRLPSQNPRFNSHTNSGFLHSRRRPRTLKGFTGELDVSFDLKLS